MNKFLFFTILAVMLIVPGLGYAEGFIDKLPEPCVKAGNCNLNDIYLGFTYLIQLMLGFMGAVALLYFIWGGIQWLVSGGNADRVKRGQQIMINTMIALFIAFSSYLLTSFFVNDILGVTNSRYRIESACVGANEGTRCNDTERNYVCTGTDTFEGEMATHNETCVTKCQLKSLLAPENEEWACVDLDGIGSALPVGMVSEAGLCPGDTSNICVKDGLSLWD